MNDKERELYIPKYHMGKCDSQLITLQVEIHDAGAITELVTQLPNAMLLRYESEEKAKIAENVLNKYSIENFLFSADDFKETGYIHLLDQFETQDEYNQIRNKFREGFTQSSINYGINPVAIVQGRPPAFEYSALYEAKIVGPLLKQTGLTCKVSNKLEQIINPSLN